MATLEIMIEHKKLQFELLTLYELLHDNFTPLDMKILCYDYFLLVYDQGGQDKDEAFIWRWIDFAQTRQQLDKLFSLIKKYRRTAYEQFVAQQLELNETKKQETIGVVFYQQGQQTDKQWNIGHIETANFS